MIATETTTETGDIRTAVAVYVCAKCDSPIEVGATFAWFPRHGQRVCNQCTREQAEGSKRPHQDGTGGARGRE